MQKNVGTLDKTVRIIVGLGLLAMLIVREDSARWFGLIGIVPLFTALTSWCPLYTVLGIKTCPVSNKE